MLSIFAQPDALLPPREGDAVHPPAFSARPQPPAAAAAVSAAPAPADANLLLDWPERVAVPGNRFEIDDALMGQIRAQFDPLSGPRGEHGIPLIRGLLAFLDSVQNRATN